MAWFVIAIGSVVRRRFFGMKLLNRTLTIGSFCLLNSAHRVDNLRIREAQNRQMDGTHCLNSLRAMFERSKSRVIRESRARLAQYSKGDANSCLNR
jgi:hypothetical protein